MAQPTGGTITYDGDYTIHTFTESGTFHAEFEGSVTADVLVVGKGGNGGGGGDTSLGGCGGGGAGAYIFEEDYELTTGDTAVTIGGTCSFGSGGGAIEAIAGGEGGSSDPLRNATGADGGSGGGSSGNNTAGNGTVGQGNTGGTGYGTLGSTNVSGGGGGGAGGTGANGTDPSGGSGGAGTANSISGSSVTYCKGGDGGDWGGSSNGADGVNPGDGGGGVDSGGSTLGYGHDGIVIIRYLTSSFEGTSASATPSLSKSLSPSLSPSATPSASVSPSLSVSATPSESISASPSVTGSASPSVSQSVSVSRSPSISKSASPSISISASPSTSPPPPETMIKVAKSGVDALTDTDPNHFIFWSKYNTFKILKEGNSAQTYIGDGRYAIAHGLSSYSPTSFMVFVKFPDGYTSIVVGTGYVKSRDANWKIYDCYIDETEINMYVGRIAGSDTALNFKYYIFETPFS